MNDKKFPGNMIPRVNFYIWVILVLVAVIAVLDWRIAIPGFLLLGVLAYYNTRVDLRRQREITKYIENLTFNIDTATKDTLLNSPMPLVVMELDGTIIWYNSLFRKIFDNEDLLEQNISSLAGELHLNNLVNETANISQQVTINNMHYSVLGNFIKLEEKSERNSYILFLYFINNTELIETKKKYREEKMAVGIIVMDNYDDLIQGVEDSIRPQMFAEIETRIIQWTDFTSGIIKRFERDKYLYIFEVKYMKKFEEKKFDILDIVKEINTGNKIPVTLSLGFGVNGKSLAEKFSFAAASIDIALGRGGDQAVVKNGESFSFFGGKTRELEKRTRVKARVIAYALRELINQSPNVMIMGHENADIDSLGASLGIYRIVKNRGRDVNIVLGSSNIAVDKLMAKINLDEQYNYVFIGRNEALDKITRKTLLIIVDTYRASFTECPELLKHTDQVVVIDHHRKCADFIQDAVLTYQETYASSTCELIAEIIQYVEENLKLRPIEVEALYAGIVVDTKNFTFKTGVRTFEAASYLRRQGADTVSVKQLFQYDLSTYSIISSIVKNAEIINNNIAVSICPFDLKNSQYIAAKSADELLGLSGLVAAFVLSGNGKNVTISGRSLGDVNVQVILEKLGGGGHLSVAGAQIQNISVEDAKEKLKCVIIEYIGIEQHDK